MDDYLYFMTIVEEGTITKAAEKLYISQPSLSKYLKKLEMAVGYQLLDRSSYPLRLTNEGLVFYEYIEKQMQLKKHLKRDLLNASSDIKGKVNIGFTVWRSSIVMPTVFPPFHKVYPEIQIKLFEGSHKYLLSQINNGNVDIALIHRPNSFSGLTYDTIMDENILFLVNKRDPLLSDIDFSLKKVNLMTLDQFRLFVNSKYILLKEGQNLRDICDYFLLTQNIAPDVALVTSNIVTAMNLVKNNYGVTFIPAFAKLDGDDNDLVYFQIDSSILKWELAFAYKEGHELSKVSRLFMEYAKDFFYTYYRDLLQI